MSSTFGDVVTQWVANNKYPPGDTADELLVLSVPSTASANLSIVKWHSAVTGIFEFQAVWDSQNKRLNDASLTINILGFGNALLFSGQNINVPTDQISVQIPGASVNGTVKFSLQDGESGSALNFEWNVFVPWHHGISLSDNRCLFPADANSSAFALQKLKDINAITDLEVSALRKAPLSPFEIVTGDLSGGKLIKFTDSPGDDVEKSIAAAFIHDNVGAGNPIVTLAAGPQGNSEGQVLNISFQGIFQLVGSISTSELNILATLYVNIPIVGRIELVKLVGSLLDEGVTENVNLAIAKGSVNVKARTNAVGKHDLYINLNLDIKFVKTFNTGDLKLLSLPF